MSAASEVAAGPGKHRRGPSRHLDALAVLAQDQVRLHRIDPVQHAVMLEELPVLLVSGPPRVVGSPHLLDLSVPA